MARLRLAIYCMCKEIAGFWRKARLQKAVAFDQSNRRTGPARLSATDHSDILGDSCFGPTCTWILSLFSSLYITYIVIDINSSTNICPASVEIENYRPDRHFHRLLSYFHRHLTWICCWHVFFWNITTPEMQYSWWKDYENGQKYVVRKCGTETFTIEWSLRPNRILT